MNVSEAAIILYLGVACAAFLITQIHLWRTGNKILRKSDASWARVDGTIAKVQGDFKSQIQQIREDVKSGGGNDVKAVIAEVADVKIKLGGIPNFLEDRLTRVSANLSENFVLLQTAINQKIDSAIPAIPRFNPGVNLGDPREAQEAGAMKKNVNKIVNAIDARILDQTLGGRMATLLDSMGEPALKEWMQEHPQAYPALLQTLQSNPRTRVLLERLEGQGSHPGQSRSGNGGEL